MSTENVVNDLVAHLKELPPEQVRKHLACFDSECPAPHRPCPDARCGMRLHLTPLVSLSQFKAAKS